MLCPVVRLFASRVTLFLPPLYVHLIVFICALDVQCNSPLCVNVNVNVNVNENTIFLARVSHIGHRRNSATGGSPISCVSALDGNCRRWRRR